MPRTHTLLLITLIVVSLILIGTATYQLGLHHGRERVYRTQAILAFGHYTQDGWLIGLLEKKCYEDALAMAKLLRGNEASLFADNLRSAGNDPDVMTYVRRRDPELLSSALSGHIPGPGAIETRCEKAR